MQWEPGNYVTAIDHIGIAVPDLEEAIAFYRENFGFRVVHREVNDEQGVVEAMLQPAEDAHGTAIQLLAPSHPDSIIAQFINRDGPGLQQLAYRVTSIETASAVLSAQGIRLIYDTPVRGTANSRVNFIHPKDTGGVLIELVEPAGVDGDH